MPELDQPKEHRAPLRCIELLATAFHELHNGRGAADLAEQTQHPIAARGHTAAEHQPVAKALTDRAPRILEVGDGTVEIASKVVEPELEIELPTFEGNLAMVLERRVARIGLTCGAIRSEERRVGKECRSR